MTPRPAWLVTRDSPALGHLTDLCDTLGRAVRAVAQAVAADGSERDRVERDLSALDAAATAALMAFLTALRSAYVTPVPRPDLYRLADGVKTAAHRVVGAGVLVHRADLDALPRNAVELLETLGRQAELLAHGTRQLRDLDALEDTWMQLERGIRRMERLMVDWLAALGTDLLQRDYNRQREIASALRDAVLALDRVNTDLGVVLVRES
ncbi:hypothetical protein KW076_01100 [Micrococcus porci]|uniref:hypothetical protein n=1 Tax=Micrococcus porci TaxID=2856555 RepID=UPI001CCFF7EA|nr:hypothetical protein [Micrococcus porci]UBH24828.1 hypothetical protein KW076_01100 [Micrococcus porci]